MADPNILRRNERIKAFASVGLQLGVALAGAAAVKIYAELVWSWEALLWFSGGAALMWIAYLSLGLLDTEDD